MTRLLKRNSSNIWRGCVGLAFLLAGSAAFAQSENDNAWSGDALWVDQGWSQKEIDQWYTLSQGSRLIPLSWYENMRSARTGYGFASRENMAVLGYPFAGADAELPIGFVVDQNREGDQWVGFTCSACHTSQVSFEGQTIRVHGGQNMADFYGLLKDIVASVEALPQDEEAMAKILANPRAGDQAALERDIDAWLAQRKDIDRIIDDTEAWGPGRLDAVGYILARIEQLVQTHPPEARDPANAPTNMPVVWNANQQGLLQYNGLIPNGTDYGVFGTSRLGAYFRNYGEALGVFAQSELKNNKMSSSIRADNLLTLEGALLSLQSPLWPEDVLGEIDADQAKIGKRIYQKNCKSCHAEVPHDELTQAMPVKTAMNEPGDAYIFMQAMMDPSTSTANLKSGEPPNQELVGTDPAMICNFITRISPTGQLAGKLKQNSTKPKKYVTRFEDTAPAVELLAAIEFRDFEAKLANGELASAYVKNEVKGLRDVIKDWFDPYDEGWGRLLAGGGARELSPYESYLGRCTDFTIKMMNEGAMDEFPSYKARPLNGIWASAPYLHNGSVPTLRDLLEPVENRPERFTFSGFDFDPERVGYQYEIPEVDAEYDFRVRNAQGDVIIGNWNGGHSYGTHLSAEEKDALIWYLKTL